MLNVRALVLLAIAVGIIGLIEDVEAGPRYEYNGVVGEVIEFKHEKHPIQICSKLLGIQTDNILWDNYKKFESPTICSANIRCQNPDEPSSEVIELDEKPAEGSVCGFLWPPIGGEDVCIKGKCVEVTLID